MSICKDRKRKYRKKKWGDRERRKVKESKRIMEEMNGGR